MHIIPQLSSHLCQTNGYTTLRMSVDSGLDEAICKPPAGASRKSHTSEGIRGHVQPVSKIGFRFD